MPRNERSAFRFFGGCQALTASTFFASHLTPSWEMTWPKYVVSRRNRWHFLGLSFMPAARSRSSTTCKLLMTSSIPGPYTMTSSMYARAILCSRPCNILSMRRWNVRGAPTKPNGIWIHSQWVGLTHGTWNAVFCFAVSVSSTLW